METPPPPPVRIPEVGTRLAMMLLDHVIFSIAMFILIVPFWFYWMLNSVGQMEAGAMPSDFFKGMWVVFIPYALAFAIYMNKDAIGARSPGKRIMKAKVVRQDTLEAAGPLRCMVRNLTLIFWPLEALLAIINSDRRRLGDYIAGTRVIMRDAAEPAEPIRWGSVAGAYASGLAIIIAVMLPFYLFFQSMAEKMPVMVPPTQEQGYQEDRSWELEPPLREALGNTAELEMVRVYERSAPVPGWFVVLHLNVEETDIDDEMFQNELRSLIRPVLEEKLNDLPVQGRMRLVAGGEYRTIIL